MEAKNNLQSPVRDAQRRKISNRRSRTGTREWAETTINIQRGCEHDCRYCYARWDAVTRRKQCARHIWKDPHIFADRVEANYRLLKGRIMFPSTHDITNRNIAECLVVLRKLLEVGNEVLIVSKPDYDVVALMVESLRRYQHRVAFRFTIGSTQNDVLAFWEAWAPSFESRIKSLSCAYLDGYMTSVSCEPYLDAWPQHVYEACRDYLSDIERFDGAGGIWFGKLRNWAARVDLTGATDEQIAKYVTPLRAAQNDAFVRGLVRTLDGRKFVRWKDSIREVIEKAATESTEGTEE